MNVVENTHFYSKKHIEEIYAGENGARLFREILDTTGHEQETLIFEQLVQYLLKQVNLDSYSSKHLIEERAGEILDSVKGQFIEALKAYQPRYKRTFIHNQNSYPFHQVTFYNN